MPNASFRRIISTVLGVALALATHPTFAVTPPATLTGTVYGNDVKTPLSGAIVVVRDAAGVKLASEPTTTAGTFTVTSITPGQSVLALETEHGAFPIETPVLLAPGETRGVRLALKADADPPADEEKKKKGGAYWTGTSIAAMSAVLLGFATAGLVARDESNSDDQTPVSPSTPADK